MVMNPEYRCKRCGNPRLSWQVFCGAACCAMYEAGDRPLERDTVPELPTREALEEDEQ
jgi:hypothetical protein